MKENTRREQAFQWILWNVLRHNDSKRMRWWEILVRYFFMPFNTFWYYLDKHHEIVGDYEQIIRLFGIDYHISVFRALIEPGSVFKVVESKYGTVMIEKVDRSLYVETKSTPATFRENIVKKIPLIMNFKNNN